ncbi:TetR family transcriptional regulator [Ktedonobacter sp. SOSP1-85]|uniref:TetR/AcrR family transcriptional regulator n=1 Tax=Ktedonobacter sp. SOSP1-85 TaxID=2778367 RepID=UPI001915DA9F|nr:TetR/AcrR family transcriptional regulator [Ktedonobacter sp. SOSP1-85]GHO78518.1 TetR family transcriptional regulator [Ktedonobacter sp. SOSP1-85]
MTTPTKRMDRSVQRTRQLLRQASIDVMKEKGFSATSIRDIAERANVNRGTFYAHFADKYDLLEALLREEVQHLILDGLPPVSRWDKDTLCLLIQTVLEGFEKLLHACYPSPVRDALLERVIQEELAALLLAWLKQARQGTTHRQVSLETTAQVASWAIFGAAVQWSRGTTTKTSEQMAQDVLLIITEGMAPGMLRAR